MRYMATILLSLLLVVPGITIELFRYQYRTEDGGECEAVFESDEQIAGKPVVPAEGAMDWIRVFYRLQVSILVKFQQRYQMRHRKSRDEDARWGFNSAISSF